MSQFCQDLYQLESSNMVYICRMNDCIVGLRLRVMTLIYKLFYFYPFFPFPILHVNIKICVRVFSGTIAARIWKHGIHMDNELYCAVGNRTHCSYSSLYLSIFLSFKAKFVSVLSGTVQTRIFIHGIHM